jgi:hypothetical protein
VSADHTNNDPKRELDPRLRRALQQLGAQMLAEASPVTSAEVMPGRGGAPLHDPLLRPNAVDVPLARTTYRRTIGSGPSPGRRRGALIGAVAAVSILVVGLGVVRGGDPKPSPAGETAAAPTTAEVVPSAPPFTETNLTWPPRLAVGTDVLNSWSLTRLSETGTTGVDSGFAVYDGQRGRQITIGYSREGSGHLVRREGGVEAGHATAFGADAVLYEYTHDSAPPAEGSAPTESSPAPEGGSEGIWYEVIVQFDGHELQMSSGPGMTLDAFVAAVEQVRPIDVTEWGSMLFGYVLPAERPEVIDSALAGVTLPEGFDVEAWRTSPAVASLEDLNLQVGTAVVCAWVDDWAAATKRGDTAAAEEAAHALGTATEWPAFNGYRDDSLAVFQVTTAISTGNMVVLPNQPPEHGELTPDNVGGWIDCPGWESLGEG